MQDRLPIGKNERKAILDEVKDLLSQEHITGADVSTLGTAVTSLIVAFQAQGVKLASVSTALADAQTALAANALDTTGVVQATADVKAIDDNANATLAGIKALLEPAPATPPATPPADPGDGSAPAGSTGN